ncbi:MAG: PLDc N-terminal domain-containing protein [Gammaproteobacteria bacterium]
MENILGIIILIADIWAILNIFQSSVDTFKKALWIGLVLVLPLLGVIIWYFAGPRKSTTVMTS